MGLNINCAPRHLLNCELTKFSKYATFMLIEIKILCLFAQRKHLCNPSSFQASSSGSSAPTSSGSSSDNPENKENEDPVEVVYVASTSKETKVESTVKTTSSNGQALRNLLMRRKSTTVATGIAISCYSFKALLCRKYHCNESDEHVIWKAPAGYCLQ